MFEHWIFYFGSSNFLSYPNIRKIVQIYSIQLKLLCAPVSMCISSCGSFFQIDFRISDLIFFLLVAFQFTFILSSAFLNRTLVCNAGFGICILLVQIAFNKCATRIQLRLLSLGKRKVVNHCLVLGKAKEAINEIYEIIRFL